MLLSWVYAITSVIVVSLLSLVGVLTFSISTERLKRTMFLLVSFAAGSLLGDVFIHLLPEILEESSLTLRISLTILGGIAFMFVIEKMIHWHHCHFATDDEHAHPVALMNLVGDGTHNFIDGLIIGASYLVSIPVGIATTVAVIAHEIPQEVSDFGVLLHSGLTKRKALLYNFITATMAIVGTLVALFIGQRSGTLVSFLVPFTVGGFIYIAGADLIPELHKELALPRSVLQFIAFIFGIGIMTLLLLLE